jgi:hypothetical protein
MSFAPSIIVVLIQDILMVRTIGIEIWQNSDIANKLTLVSGTGKYATA